jgi:DNA polymerase-3 subunit alpha
MFTHLQVHTHYSLLEAIWSPKAYIEQAKELGMQALGYTDYGGMYGAIEFYQAAKKAGIKPLIGVELGYVDDMHRQDAQESAGTILLLARSYAGYEQLMLLISAAHLEGFHKIPRIDHACLAKHATDLTAIIGGDRSRLGKQLLNANNQEQLLDQRNQLCNTLWKENCYLSRVIQEKPHGALHEVNTLINEFATKHTIPVLISGDVHYIQAKDQNTFETALAIKDGKRIYDTDRRLATRQMHLQTVEEITARATLAGWSDEQITTAFQLTQEISNSINLEIPMDTILFPIYESPEEIKTSFAARKEQLITQ